MYYTWDYWVSGHCPLSQITEKMKFTNSVIPRTATIFFSGKNKLEFLLNNV
jgi:hypothetical protein